MYRNKSWLEIEKAINSKSVHECVACFIEDYETLKADLLASHIPRTEPRLERKPSKPLGRIYADRETMWERAFHDVFGPDAPGRDLTLSIGGTLVIASLQVHQAPMEQRKSPPDIDLLAFGPDGAPVVVELKQEKSRDYLPKVIIQAARYGLFTRRNLTNSASSQYIDEWQRVVSPQIGRAPSLEVRDVVCAAPGEWWGRQDRLPGPVHALVDHLARVDGLRVWFAEMEGEPETRSGLGMIPRTPKSVPLV